ncbi:MAG: hypothetical protein WCX73_03015 [Candidatus Pacearchaeota archaeon]|jgi:hypothetical protein
METRKLKFGVKNFVPVWGLNEYIKENPCSYENDNERAHTKKVNFYGTILIGYNFFMGIGTLIGLAGLCEGLEKLVK